MNALVIIGGLTAVYLIVALAITKRNHDSASKWFGTLQTICAVGAFGLAAFWYFIERKAQPHADVTQELHAVQVSPGLAAVEVHVSLKNLGSQLLTLKHARVTLQMAQPGVYDYEALWAKKGQDYWSALKSKPGEPDNPYFDEAELRWFPVREYDGEIYHRIEPEETDLLVATFLVKCTAKVVRVATAIERRTDWLNREQMTWTARSFLDLGETCAPEETEGAVNPKKKAGK
ncbi:hypothetical protein ACFB49_02490 [Sphingomonas sp. DBB INV C78]|uniref:hypothetical protein n=1 Tax=Sphingomonas sp. DBB INV C78 TaxID=3349434 RepID=UPI0036D3D6AA